MQELAVQGGCCAGMGRRVGRRLGVRALALVLLLAAAAVPAQTHRFRMPQPAVPLPLGPEVLSAAERAYIAALPEVRVGLPLPPPRPYEDITASGEITGIHPEILVYLATAFGLRLRPVVLPSWSATLQAARAREVDLVMTIGITPQRLQYLEFTLGVTPWPGALVARKGVAAPPALASARFAIEREFLAVDFVHRQFPQAAVDTVADTGAALAEVAAGRADYYLGSLLETVDWLARRPVPGVEVLRIVNYGGGHYHFGIRKDWAPLAAILNKGISALRSTPTPQWSAATSALPATLALQPPLALTPAETATLVAHPTWRVGAVRGLAMLNDVDERGVHSGIGAEYVEQVARQLGVAMAVVPFADVGSMLDALRAGIIDVVPFLTRTPERERDFVFSAPYVEMPYMIVARSDAPLYWDLDSLRGRRVALARQHPLRERLARDYADIHIVTTANGNAAMDAVAAGQADAAVEIKLFANLRVNGDGQLRTVAAVGDLPAQFQFAASQRAAALIPLVNRALAAVPDGERERMLRRWVAVDLAPPFPWQRHAPVIAMALAALVLLAAATLWWMRRLTREVKARRRSEEQLADIGAALPCIAFRYLVDDRGELRRTYYSAGARALLGIDLQPGRTILDNIAARLQAGQLRQLQLAQQACLRSGAAFRFAVAYAHPDGRERWLHAEAVRTPTRDGLDAWTGYVVDMSGERELQARVMREAEARNLLLASASHELRAPTHTLTLALESLQAEALAAEAREALRVARDAASMLTQLLSDVLDAASLSAGGMQLRPQRFDLHDLASRVADAFRAGAHAKGLQLQCRIDAAVPAWVWLDPLRMRQVLTNLLSNAIKYTAAGRVRLDLGLLPGPEGTPRLRMVVSDTGMGISREQQDRLFKPFAATVDGGPVVPEGSTGLGLMICRRLVELMGGTVALQSAPGEGTQVTVNVPLPPLPAAPQPAAPTALQTAPQEAPPMPPPSMRPGVVPGGAGPTVLLCDDDDTSRLLMAHLMTQRGCAVIEACNGDAALALWREREVDVLVTDVELADGLGGLGLVRAVREEEQRRGAARPTRVVVCSGTAPPSQPPGVALHDAWLVKPVHPDALAEALQQRAAAGATA